MEEKIKQFLLEIQSDIKAHSDDPEFLIQKFQFPVGKESGRVSVVFSHDIPASLNSLHGIEVSQSELDSILPDLCKELNIKVEPMKHDTTKDFACYRLTF